jgi:hypothetical protein
LWLNLEAQQFAKRSHYRVYKQLTELRKKPVFQQGDTEVAALSERVLGFTRCLSYIIFTYSISVDIVSFVEDGVLYCYGLACF